VPTIVKPSITKGQGLKNNCYEPHKPTTATTRLATDHNQIVVEPPPLPSPLDANNGPKTVMKAIDAWLDYQDYLNNKQALSLPHRSNADEEHHPPPGIEEQPMEQQPNIQLCQTITMEHILQLGDQLNGLRAPRKRFSWCQGFLKAHKPPTCWPTPMSQPKTHHGSATKGANNTSSILPAVSQPTVPATDPISEKKAFLQCYDLCLNLHSMDGTTYSEWEGITNLLSQMQGINKMIAVWPWAVMDQHCHLPIAINIIACTFLTFKLHTRPG